MSTATEAFFDIKSLTSGNVCSQYQMETVRDVSQALVSKLKKYLHATLCQIVHLNSMVGDSVKVSPFLDLEIDSIVCRSLFSLKVELNRCFKKVFEQFDEEIVAAVSKSFNTSEDEL